MSTKIIYLFIFIAAVLFPVNLHAQEQEAKYRFMVVDIQDQTGHKGWENHLIAYGIKSIVSDELYNTGQYIPIDDNPEIAIRINEMIAASWKNKKAHSMHKPSFVDNPDCDALVAVVVQDFKLKRLRSIGIFAAAKTTVEVVVKVDVQYRDGSIITATGSGKGITKSLGVLFQIREDKIYFNETTVGQATRKAIHNAISKFN
ncbi:hypothetical protein BuS5_01954 [Desulfosarcina sp. BuS5]|uniref:hypothetical protein n=1 Tax=Desulfosarcina sp. BuS5 TaxID=933262 RepID=UPI000487F0A3|nr:hypothetical protein [Desulfosarcina sp. BuS5]WDN88986.1 hypothetical protein BuS5_01954 [Desulfosarcina sp. BuS5]